MPPNSTASVPNTTTTATASPSATPAASGASVPTLPIQAATTSTQPIQPVQPTPATGNATLAGFAGANADQFQSQLDANAAAAKQAYQTPLSAYVSALGDSQGQSALTADQYAKGGVNDAQSALLDVNNRILAEKNATQQTLQNLKNNNSQGFFGTGLSQAMQKIQDQSDARLANMAVQQAAASGNYSVAKEIADRAVQAKYEQQQNYLTALKTMADDAKATWTTAQQQDFEAALATRNSQIETQKSEDLARFNQQIAQSDPKYQAELYTARTNAGLDPTTGAPYNSGGNQGTVVNGYQLGASDTLGAYASNTATQVANVQATVNKISTTVGTVASPAQAQAALEAVAPGSPITGDMVMQAAQKYGVDPSVIIGVMQAETQCGTDGSKGAKQCNWGNVGNTDAAMANGKSVAMTPQQGVDAVAQNLAKRKTAAGGAGTGTGTTTVTAQNLPANLQPYYKTSYDGTPYLDLSSLTPSQKQTSAIVAERLGIKPIINATEADKLSHLSVAKSNLQDVLDSFNSVSSPGGVPLNIGIGNSIRGFFGDPTIKAYQNYRTTAVNTLQALAGGAGSGFRISQAEVQAAIADIPVLTGTNADTPASAAAKIANLNNQLDKWQTQILGGGNHASDKTDQYAAYRAQVPAGHILINRNGQIGTVPESEYNPSTDVKL